MSRSSASRLGAAWQPDSWTGKPALQQPAYPDAAALAGALRRLAELPPLVTSWEIEALKQRLAAVQAGQAFVLWGGDCAESFAECSSANIVQKLKILLQMSVVITSGLKKPVVRIGRMAGQYAKPRSADTESRDGIDLPSYRGDLVNGAEFTAAARAPDPQRLIQGYQHAALTLNFIRSLTEGGFADLHHPENWDLNFVSHAESAAQYQQIVRNVSDALDFFETVTGQKIHQAQRVDFYASHEALHLPYEQAQTRYLEHRGDWYDLTTHLPWIGMRTADPGGAHVEFFSGVRNPVAVKIGPGTTRDTLARLTGKLNPRDEPGRLALVHRLGAARVESELPRLIGDVREIGASVVWICDPMHGNTERAASGVKTRRFENILDELQHSFAIHAAHDSILGGVHLELTGDHVTECTGGARGLTDDDLGRDYRTQVDPRLNYEQAMEVALVIAGWQAHGAA